MSNEVMDVIKIIRSHVQTPVLTFQDQTGHGSLSPGCLF